MLPPLIVATFTAIAARRLWKLVRRPRAPDRALGWWVMTSTIHRTRW